ncbi:uncharacterized protein OCT59_021869 [Rhizophagus irregularis]|nr:hypothetical protein GLOIN_2v1791691 [Rhizophagus irregularis DAOM 181602=DAOM 197198]POG57259.1 hypothetical protein GLOIN_2v1791691 [Rhizophagus irregularis DAOM 181602=DAOM 197198]UZO28341.1 hypothetical protein OCT59_021869 [Rhizophagus irregularis]GBC35856.2 hypothetical protein GLOIN_2v1791691 [Rhizophagus irregularis DAOM 181602=DAOM 197198]|eukprot:XP_025164400.1 hypothetical protein GLOIN_2v1791691 [Rhizophagus irregularis DAOM 181602=DAOM 197198]
MNQIEVSNGIVSPPITPITPITLTATIDLRFECILVYYIRKKLPRGYKQLGKQTVSVPATESQFYAVFKNYIHYYSTRKGFYKYIFREVSANQMLANILDIQKWEVKFYEQQQRIYVILCDDDDNIESDDENPILRATKQCKSKYKCGQLIVEWKQLYMLPKLF